ncbi:MAG: hypothetical protein HYY64_06930, partial [Candidatus Rokubacteria bacterium]|nr:hypothetical protein [Candidatus Rokubacteria bacterium]
MKALATIAMGGALVVALWAPSVGAQEIKDDLKDIRQDRREIRQDTREIRQDRRELREDREALREAIKSGDKDAIRKAR